MKIINIKETPSQIVIAETIKVLKSGGLVLFPTETTYGAGVDATNQSAVDKLLNFKSRREGKPLSIVVVNQEMAARYVEINEQANQLYRQFLPGPVTVVSKILDENKLANGVASEFGTLGIRIPDYELILEISNRFGLPITATSANASGKKRPYSLSDIFSNLSEKQKGLVDLVLDAGNLPKNDPSTIIDTTLSAPVTLRSRNNSTNNNETTIQNKNNQSVTLISNSEKETKEIAGRLLLKYWSNVNTNGFVFGLDGDLGIGKTIFAKGTAKFLKIEDIIKSPTYSYIEEYDFTRHQTKGKLFHLDMWKVEDQNMFDRLEIDKLLEKNNVVVIEWFDQIEKFITPLLIQKNIPVVKIKFKQVGEQRQLTIQEKN